MWGRGEMNAGICWEKPEGMKPLVNPGVHGRIILKWILEEWDGGHGLDLSGSG
jgi:hypothetical protein